MRMINKHNSGSYTHFLLYAYYFYNNMLHCKQFARRIVKLETKVQYFQFINLSWAQVSYYMYGVILKLCSYFNKRLLHNTEVSIHSKLNVWYSCKSYEPEVKI